MYWDGQGNANNNDFLVLKGTIMATGNVTLTGNRGFAVDPPTASAPLVLAGYYLKVAPLAYWEKK
jgi:hypothetical protein